MNIAESHVITEKHGMKGVERGSQTVESVLFVPALMLAALIIAFSARIVDAATAVRHAADVGARVATRSRPAAAVDAGRKAAASSLALAAPGCAGRTIRAEVGVVDGMDVVTVSVRCAVDMSGMGPLSRLVTVSAESSEVVDVHVGR